jgi:hypothetical protein
MIRKEGVSMLRRHQIITSVTIGVVLIGFGCVPTPSEFATPDGTVTYVVQQLEQDKPEVLWDAMPASYQADVTTFTHEVANKMDAELYTKVITILQKATEILKTKKEIILGSAIASNSPVDIESIGQKWDAIVAFLDTLVNSELADLEKCKTLDIRKLLAGTGTQLMMQGSEISSLFPTEGDKQLKEKLTGVQVEIVSSEAESAIVKITVPDEQPEEVELVLIEERWVPKELADTWAEELAKAEEELASWDEQKIAENKVQAMMILSMVETFLDQLAQVESSEEFDRVIGSMMGGMLGGLG